MLFANEQLTVSATVYRLTENTYTISSQHADYAYFTLNGGDIDVRYDGVNDGSSNVQLLSEGDVDVFKLESREQIEGFRFYVASGSPVVDIQYVMLEWTDLRRITLPKLKLGAVRRTKSSTQKVGLASANVHLRRISDRPLHEFDFNSLWLRGMKDEEEVHGFFYVHQGDIPFYLFANKFSIVEFPTLIGYGDASTEQFFLPARFIRPFTDKIFLDGMEVDGYSLNNSSGLVSFYTAPPNKVLVTATFAHYYKCVFRDDTLEDTLLVRDNTLLGRNYRLMEIRP